MRHGAWWVAWAMLSACTAVHYESPRLAERAPGQETIAVLPFEMVITGRVPPGIGEGQLREWEEAESLAFQRAFYNRLLDRSSSKRKRPIRVHIQPLAETLRRLEGSGIGVRESWRLDSALLAKVLAVDAVVRTRVVKERYLSDLASYGTELGIEVLQEATGGDAAWLIPPGLTRTHDIHMESSLIDGEDSDLLWKVEVHRSTDWRRPAADVVVGLTRKLARKFPYRG